MGGSNWELGIGVLEENAEMAPSYYAKIGLFYSFLSSSGLWPTRVLTIINRQYIHPIIRSASSVSANYRAAARAKSATGFVYKLKICEEEADETQHWLELLLEFNKGFEAKIMTLHKECNELVAIFVASIRTVKQKATVAKDKGH
jgi:four helix bundle protein